MDPVGVDLPLFKAVGVVVPPFADGILDLTLVVPELGNGICDGLDNIVGEQTSSVGVVLELVFADGILNAGDTGNGIMEYRRDFLLASLFQAINIYNEMFIFSSFV